MSVFGAYSRYYDLFYGDKDYRSEAAFVDVLLRDHGLAAASILDVGCGTGRHAREMVELGHTVHGVDLSETMLEAARALAGPSLSFEQGDARTLDLGRTFDAVVSLFHVMSYQTTNADLLAAFRSAAAHLRPGGLFVFDFWYGPAVLTERPEHRVRTLEGDGFRVTREATPVMRPNDNVCEVVYDIVVESAETGERATIAETHPMRYLFLPELELALAQCGFEAEEACEFLTRGELSFDTWNGCVVARKRA